MRCASAHASSARLRIDLGQRSDQLERRGELADLLDGAIDEREPEAILDERAPQPSPVRGTDEAIRRLDRGRLGDRHADGEVGGEHDVERQVRVAGADVHDEIIDGERAHPREPAALAPRAELQRRLDGVVRSGQDREARDAGRDERLEEILRRSVERRRMRERGQPELRVHVRAGGIAVDQRHALAELREIHREVLRDEALADAAPSAAYREKLPRSTYAFEMIELDRRRGKLSVTERRLLLLDSIAVRPGCAFRPS